MSEKLIKAVSSIIVEYEEKRSSTASDYNIFDVIKIETNEDKITRVLYDLLNPKGKHRQGHCYLRIFLNEVLELEISEVELNNFAVYREYVIDAKRRIDIVLKSDKTFIPIEVKIYAKDQVTQCFDYYNHRKKLKLECPLLLYLTLYGELPSKESAKGMDAIMTNHVLTGYDGIRTISFKNDIVEWLEKCIEKSSELVTLKMTLEQLKSSIQKITHTEIKGSDQAVKKIIEESPDHMRSAVDIERNLKTVKVDFIHKILKDLDKIIASIYSTFTRINDGYDYENHNALTVKTYYDRMSPTCPGFSYSLGFFEGYEICLRVEIAYSLVIGFCKLKDNSKNNDHLDEKILEQLMPNYKQPKNDWWLYREDVYFGSENDTIDFKGFSDAYFNLFDETKYNEFLEDFKSQLERMISNNLIAKKLNKSSSKVVSFDHQST